MIYSGIFQKISKKETSIHFKISLIFDRIKKVFLKNYQIIFESKSDHFTQDLSYLSFLLMLSSKDLC